MKRSLFFVAAFAVLIGMAAAPVHADKDINATVIWRAFDDQFQSGFRIIMEHEAEKIDGITLEMQDGENDVSKTTNKLEAALTKGADAIAVCAPDRLCTAEFNEES